MGWDGISGNTEKRISQALTRLSEQFETFTPEKRQAVLDDLDKYQQSIESEATGWLGRRQTTEVFTTVKRVRQSLGKVGQDNAQALESSKVNQPPPAQYNAALPSYEQIISEEGWRDTIHEASPQRGFTQVYRVEDEAVSYNIHTEKDKLHVSVNRAQMKEAYDAIVHMLFEETSPVWAFKFTRLDKQGEYLKQGLTTKNGHDRICNGAQITLYLLPYKINEDEFTEQQHAQYANFVIQLESTLSKHNIVPGDIPDSDAPVGKYISYRHEKYPRELDLKDDWDLQSFNQMKNQPVYQALQTNIAHIGNTEKL